MNEDILRRIRRLETDISEMQRLTKIAPLHAGKGKVTPISGGQIEVTRPYVQVVPESGITDNLDAITNGSDGKIIVVTPAHDGDTITLRPYNVSGGNIDMRGAGNGRTLADRHDSVMLMYRESTGHWEAVSPSWLDGLIGVVISAPTDGQVLTYDGTTGNWINEAPTGGGGVDQFIELLDVPALYTGAAGQYVVVKGDETGLEFITLPAAAVTSVNGQTGIVVLDADDIAETLTRIWFTTAEETKLAGIEANAQVNTVASVNGQTGIIVLDADDIGETAARIWFTTAEETKLAGIAAGAEVNVNADWSAVAGDALILNKPTIPTQYTDALARDAVGLILVDGNGINLTYSSITPSITAALAALTSDWDIGEDRAILAERVNARDVEGLSFYDDGGNLAIIINDGGSVSIPGNTTVTGTFLARRDGGAFFERTGASASNLSAALSVKTETTGSMVDGFGSGILSSHQDVDGISRAGGILGWVRDGADDTTAFDVYIYAAGVAQKIVRWTSGGLQSPTIVTPYITSPTLGGTTTFDGVQDYTLNSDANNVLVLQGQTLAADCAIRFFPKDPTGARSVQWQFISVGSPANIADRERFIFRTMPGAASEILTEAAGTGVLRALKLYTGANTNQLVLNTDGSITIGQILKAATSSGMQIQDDGGNVAIDIDDGGQVNIPISVYITGTFHVYGANAKTVERAATSNLNLSAAMTLKSTYAAGQMADGFGTGFIYSGQDVDGVGQTFGITGAVRDGADNTGQLRGYAYLAGSGQIVYVFKANKQVIFNGLTAAGANSLGIAAGTSSNDAAVGGVLYVSTAQAGNVGAGEDDLASYSVPANTLSVNNQSLWFEAWGYTANNFNAKTIRARFGSAGTNLFFSFTPTSNASWHVRGRITRTGVATQKGFGIGVGTNNTIVDRSTALNQTLSGAVPFKITGEEVADNDIVLEKVLVGWDDANT